MKSKKAIGILTVLFILFVLVLPTVCAFIPYRQPSFSDDTNVYYEVAEDGSVDYYLVGSIENPSICTINDIKFDICYYDEEGNFLAMQTVEEEINLKSGQSYQFSVLVVAEQEWWQFWAIENAEYSYTTMKAYWYYAIGISVFGICMMFFAKKKFYFDVESYKVEVYADARKTSLVIDGKLYKKLSVSKRGEEASCQFKIKGKILAITLKAGNYYPDITITLDGVVPNFTKIKQHSFLKVVDKSNKKQA